MLRLLARHYSTGVGQLRRSYAVLGVEAGCPKDALKDAYLSLVRRLHPDTGGDTADPDQFQRVRDAYAYIVEQDFKEDDREELSDLPQIFDIRHTAPQHRQYLEYGGVGFGTPSQRAKQAGQIRVMQAAGAASEYVMDRLTRGEKDDIALATTSDNAAYSRRWKTVNAMDRLVEDLILESMQKGEFRDLPGAGKPLKADATTAHLDSATAKLNQVLINNGFVPEWITAEKEIRESKDAVRLKFRNLAGAFCRQLGSGQWTADDRREYEDRLRRLNNDVATINRDIDRFNLLVPILNRQLFHLSPDRELERGLANPTPSSLPPRGPEVANSNPPGVLRLLIDTLRAK